MSDTKILLIKDLVLSSNQYTFECYGRPNTDTVYWENVNGDVAVFRHPRYSGVGYYECKVYLTLKRSMINIPIPSAHCILLNQKTYYGSGKCYFVGKGERTISETVPAEIDLSDEFGSTRNIKLEIQPCDNQVPLYFSTPPVVSYLYESDVEPTVSGIELVDMPNKTEYVSGLAFNNAGMKIRARYTDGSYRFIDGYTVTPSVVTPSTNYVTLSYGGKSVNVPITVKTDYDVIDVQSNPKGVVFDNPKVDLKTGRLLYVSQDMSVGENSFEIGVSNVYSSLTNDIIDREFSCFGKGWKLNLSQYVKKSADGNNYKYIDDLGHTHVFVKFDGNRYYDTSDAGTTLTDETDGALITDANGNIIKFNISGQISYTQSALNPKIKKCFEYSSGKLTRVYDNRNKSKNNYSSIEFRYSNGLLQGMARKNANNSDIEYLAFNYNGNKQLVWVEKLSFLDSGAPSERRAISYYEYDDNGNLTKIIDPKTKSAITVGYTANSAKHVSGGIVNGGTMSVNSYTTIDTAFIEKSRNTVENVFKRSDGSLREVNIVNERGVKSCLQFNTRNENVAAFELDGAEKRTLSREYGVKIGVNGSGSDSVNGESTRRVSTSGLELSLGSITGRAGEDEYLHYNCTVWVKLTSASTKRLRAKLTIQNSTTYAEIDNASAIVWQKVCIPVHFQDKDKKTNVGTIKLQFEDLDGAAVSADITCMRLCPGESQEMIFGTESVTNSIMLASAQKINYRNINNADVNLCNSSGVYITQNDITRAVTQPIAHGDRYDLICCGGTKRIANVKSLHFSNNSGGEMFGGSWLYLLSNSLDHRAQTKTEFSTVQLSNGNGLFVRQIVKSFANGIGGASSSEDVTSIRSAQYDAYGRVIHETDAYGLMSEYEYDNDIYENNYDIKRKRVYGSNNGSQTTNSALVYEYAYDKHGEKVVGSTDGVTSQGMFYGIHDEPKGIVFGNAADFNKLITSSGNPLSGKRQVKYEYDVFIENITQVVESGANKWKNNSFTYENGRVRTVTDGTVKYGIIRDLVADKVTTLVFNGNTELKLLEKTSTPFINGSSKTVSKIFNASGAEVYTDTVTLDKYGMLISVESSEGSTTKTLTPTYASTNGESRSCANVKKFGELSYTYNESGNLVQEIRDITVDKLFSISEIGYGETRYGFISYVADDAYDSYKTQIIYDKNCVINPRITQTRFYYSTNTNYEDNWLELSCYADDYSYDAYGRLSKINHNGNFVDEYEYCDTVDSISPLVKKYIHRTTKVSDSCRMEQTLSYDDMGRVTGSITLLGGLNGSYEVLGSFLSYTYDNLGNVTSEVKNGVSTAYTYDGKGRLASKGGKSFTYGSSGLNAGKLTSIQGGGSYSYDFYGNRSQTVKSGITRQFTYSRGNQLTKITQSGSTLAQYEVDSQGLRYIKYASGVTTEYYYDGAKLIGENLSNGMRLRFVYGAKGLDGVILINNNTRNYYKYVTDLLGNVIGIDNIDGLPLLRFEYDLFGKFTAKYHIGGKWFDTGDIDSNSEAGILLNASPFFWKGYYFDRESGYYYINGRYYDPETGTFLDAENIENIAMNAIIPGGLDRLNALIAFGVSNPLQITPSSYNIFTTKTLSIDGNYIEYKKSDGIDGSEWWHWLVGALIVVGVTAAAAILTAGVAAGIASIVGASISSAVTTAASGAVVGGIAAGGVNFFSQGIKSDWQSLNTDSLIISTAIGGAAGAISGAIGHVSNVALNSTRLLGKQVVPIGARYFRHLGIQVTSNMLIGNTVNLVQSQIANASISTNDIIIANLGGMATNMVGDSIIILQFLVNYLIDFGIEYA